MRKQLPIHFSFLLLMIMTSCMGEPATSIPTTDFGRTRIACNDSFIALIGTPGQYTCEKFELKTGVNATGMFQRFNFFGTTDEKITVSLQTEKSFDRRGYYPATITDNAEQFIQGQNDITRNAHNWSAPRRLDGYRIMDFQTQDGRICVGVFSVGGANQFGVTYWIRGYFCRAAGSGALTSEAVKLLLAGVFIRPS